MVLLRHLIIGFCIDERELATLGSPEGHDQLTELRAVAAAFH